MGLPLVQQSGEYWMQLIVNYCSSIPLLIIALVECIAVSYIYGIDRWEINTRLLTLFTIYMYNWKKPGDFGCYHSVHLHEQTGRLTVWVNGKQNSGLVNVVLEWLTTVQIGSIYQKTAAKAGNWYQTWLWRNGTLISVWKIPSGKTGLPYQMSSIAPGNFLPEWPKKACIIYFSTRFSAGSF